MESFGGWAVQFGLLSATRKRVRLSSWRIFPDLLRSMISRKSIPWRLIWMNSRTSWRKYRTSVRRMILAWRNTSWNGSDLDSKEVFFPLFFVKIVCCPLTLQMYHTFYFAYFFFIGKKRHGNRRQICRVSRWRNTRRTCASWKFWPDRMPFRRGKPLEDAKQRWPSDPPTAPVVLYRIRYCKARPGRRGESNGWRSYWPGD